MRRSASGGEACEDPARPRGGDSGEHSARRGELRAVRP